MRIRSGLEAGYPYSLSRYTDLPAGKWEWFQRQLEMGLMMALDPTTGVPAKWSLSPDDTLGLIFWTRQPENLLRSAKMLHRYRVKVHVTVTGWHEVERGGPSLEEGSEWLKKTVKTFGIENVSWRFSPVPMVADVLARFQRILDHAHEAGLFSVYLSFLQPNDRYPELRGEKEQIDLLDEMGFQAEKRGIQVILCREARKTPELWQTWKSDVCAPPEDFHLPSRATPTSEGCGCVHMVDPFTINEACVFNCGYCYTANRTSSPHKRNTTKLPVLNGR